LVDADQKVIWLHVSVKEVLILHEFDARDHLVCEHANSFQRKFTVAVLKQILKRVTK
jgi:hypothetical protein